MALNSQNNLAYFVSILDSLAVPISNINHATLCLRLGNLCPNFGTIWNQDVLISDIHCSTVHTYALTYTVNVRKPDVQFAKPDIIMSGSLV